jgi:hypothetical protein
VISDLPPSAKAFPEQASQMTRPVAADMEETRKSARNLQAVPEAPVAVLAPFAALVLFPLAVVATILLTWWVSRLLF